MEELKVGDIIKERYALVRFLGSGSFGEVWLAHDQITGRDVALKIYLSLDPTGVAEFQREYSNTIDLSSPYLLTPDHFDVYGRRPFLVMKFCENGSASKLVGSISEDQIWNFISDVANGLAVLHIQSDPIVHQDIKPDNILIDGNGRFLITDFGISKRLRATMRRQSKRDVSSGAMPYMAPERFESNPKLTTASDIWSLGASIYELATGELPFSGFGGAMQRNGAELPSLPNNFSSALNGIMQRCLIQNSEERPSASELLSWAKDKIIPYSSSSHKSTHNSYATVQETNDVTSLRQEPSNSKWILILLVIGILIGGIYWWNKGQSIVRSESVSESSHSVVEEVVKASPNITAEQLVLNSSINSINGQNVHFFKGAFYYENDIYPVMIGFITDGNRISKVIYKNMTYGGKIAMAYQAQGNQIRLFGKDGNNDFVMTLSSGEDNRLLGTATDGNKTMTVRLMPTTESFEFAQNTNVSFSDFKLGDGKISIPSFLSYRGQSDDGGPMFFDSTNEIRLFADYSSNQDLGLFRNWVNEELGSGTTLISRENCFVQSGYTINNEIYYCKAFMDNNIYPPVMYAAIILYPISRRNEIDGLLSKMFNPFPNIK